jgi:hypothetical protein
VWRLSPFLLRGVHVFAAGWWPEPIGRSDQGRRTARVVSAVAHVNAWASYDQGPVNSTGALSSHVGRLRNGTGITRRPPTIPPVTRRLKPLSLCRPDPPIIQTAP